MAYSVIAQGGFRLSGTSGSRTVTFSTVTGTAPLANDVVIITCASDDAMPSPQVLSSGWTTLFEADGTNVGRGRSCHAKRMGGTPDTTVILDYLSGSGVVAGIVSIVRGIDQTTLLASDAVVSFGSSSSQPNPPAVTTTYAPAVRVITGHLDDLDDAPNVTAPSGFSNLFAYDTGQSSSSVGATVMIAFASAPSTGSLDPDAFGTGLETTTAAHFALREAVGGTAYEIGADPGSYAVTGTAATLTATRSLSLDPGSFAVTGTDATLEYSQQPNAYEITADPGAFEVTGTDAALTATRTLPLEAGAFEVTGSDAEIELRRGIEAEPGSFAVTGTDATFVLAGNRSLDCEAGSFVVTGTDAALTFGPLLAEVAPPTGIGGGPGKGHRRRDEQHPGLGAARMLAQEDEGHDWGLKVVPKQTAPSRAEVGTPKVEVKPEFDGAELDAQFLDWLNEQWWKRNGTAGGGGR